MPPRPEESFVPPEDFVAAFPEFLLDAVVRFVGLPSGVVVLANAMENRVAVFPHVPGSGHELVDEGHCPSEARPLVSVASVVVVLVVCHGPGHSAQLEVVPADAVLVHHSYA